MFGELRIFDERTIYLHIEKIKEQFLLHPYKRKMSVVEIGTTQTLSKRREMILSGKSVADFYLIVSRWFLNLKERQRNNKGSRTLHLGTLH